MENCTFILLSFLEEEKKTKIKKRKYSILHPSLLAFFLHIFPSKILYYNNILIAWKWRQKICNIAKSKKQRRHKAMRHRSNNNLHQKKRPYWDVRYGNKIDLYVHKNERKDEVKAAEKKKD